MFSRYSSNLRFEDFEPLKGQNVKCLQHLPLAKGKNTSNMGLRKQCLYLK